MCGRGKEFLIFLLKATIFLTCLVLIPFVKNLKINQIPIFFIMCFLALKRLVKIFILIFKSIYIIIYDLR